MRTSPSPPSVNYNKSSLLLALVLYVPILFLVFYFLYLQRSEPKVLNVGSGPIALEFKNFEPTPAVPPQPEIKEVEPEPEPEPEIKKVEPVKEIPVEKPKPKPKKKPKQKVEPKPKVEQVNRSEQTAQTQSSTNAVQNVVFGRDHNPVLIAMKKAIDKNLVYPRRARLQRLSGTVTVEFKIAKAGNALSYVKVVQSSGHKILDQSALKTIEKAVSSFPQVLNDMIITIPIAFKLR